jgi:hypothetical protein
LLLLDRKKLIGLVLTFKLDFIIEKRAAKFIRRYKIAYFYVKIGLWILTTNFTKMALLYMFTLINNAISVPTLYSYVEKHQFKLNSLFHHAREAYDSCGIFID